MLGAVLDLLWGVGIVFVADRIADMFENGIIRDLVDKVKD
jgi:hypothetical protein